VSRGILESTVVRAPGIAIVSCRENVGGRSYGPEMWLIKKVRKAAECAFCDETILCGSQAYAPVSNGYNRMWRGCTRCIVTTTRAASKGA